MHAAEFSVQIWQLSETSMFQYEPDQISPDIYEQGCLQHAFIMHGCKKNLKWMHTELKQTTIIIKKSKTIIILMCQGCSFGFQQLS